MPIRSESTRVLALEIEGTEDIKGFLELLREPIIQAKSIGFKSDGVINRGDMAIDILSEIIQNPDIKAIAKDIGMFEDEDEE